jgi:hypothetical protein
MLFPISMCCRPSLSSLNSVRPSIEVLAIAQEYVELEFVRTNGRVRTRPSHHHQQVRRKRPQPPPPDGGLRLLRHWAAAWLPSTSPSCVCSRHSRSIIKPAENTGFQHLKTFSYSLVLNIRSVSKLFRLLKVAFIQKQTNLIIFLS